MKRKQIYSLVFTPIHLTVQAKGVETFWYGKYEKENSIRLANLLQKNAIAKTNMHYRRVAEGNFHVIRETKIPSALLEVGFLDNAEDAALLKQNKYRQLHAEGIRNAVIEYLR